MKNNPISQFMAMLIAFSLCTLACNAPATDTADKAVAVSEKVVMKPDMAKVKAEIQALENAWAVASNARDVATIMAFYADDAMSLTNNKPILVGKVAMEKDIKADFEKRKKVVGSIVTYETTEVFGDDKLVTEIGKTTTKDAAGKVTYAGKYMVVWEKRNDKWLTIRDIYNDDAKEK